MSASELTPDSDVFRKPCAVCGTETTNTPLTGWICTDCVDCHDVDELISRTDTQVVDSADDTITCPSCGDIPVREAFDSSNAPTATKGSSIVETHPDVLYVWCLRCGWSIRAIASAEVTDAVEACGHGIVLGSTETHGRASR